MLSRRRGCSLSICPGDSGTSCSGSSCLSELSSLLSSLSCSPCPPTGFQGCTLSGTPHLCPRLPLSQSPLMQHLEPTLGTPMCRHVHVEWFPENPLVYSPNTSIVLPTASVSKWAVADRHTADSRRPLTPSSPTPFLQLKTCGALTLNTNSSAFFFLFNSFPLLISEKEGGR